MNTYHREEAIQRMNSLAKQDKEFIFIISYDGNQAYIEETHRIDSRELMYSFPSAGNATYPESTPRPTTVRWKITPPDRDEYNRSINLVKRNIRAGNSYLANLTCRTPIETNLTLRDIFLRSKALYKCHLRNKFVCFSPEIFVRVKDGIISSYPMKGTIDATLPNADATLINDPKEAAEHATIVDLIRNDLSIVAHNVKVERYRYIDKLNTNRGAILQTSSEITGRLRPHYLRNIGSMLYALLPAGSITGAPKAKTVSIIRQAETYDRDFYTGVMGHYAKGQLDSSVMIRFIDRTHNRLYYKAGGGITSQSNNDSEYQEIINKIYVPIY